MEGYHKIKNVYLRDIENGGNNLIEGAWSTPEFAYLKDCPWICTEKIDGTNIRVIWDGFNLTFKGRTDRAEIPAHLVLKLQELFTPELMTMYFEGATNVCLYGEGYGKKIQSGDYYISDGVNFILFDIKVGRTWLKREDIESIADSLGIGVVPIVGVMTLPEAIEFVRAGFDSFIAEKSGSPAEGLIAKPKVELQDRLGGRVICKIKHRDFK